MRAGVAAGFLLASGCTSPSGGTDQSGSGGSATTTGTGGNQGSGGGASGGTIGSGGAGSGGNTGSGGSVSSGGSTGSGGATATGGSPGSGGTTATGGTTGTGGAAGAAGKSGTGGSAGATGTGGAAGSTGKGGATGTAGAPGTGGSTSTGGATGTGGTPGPALAFPGAQGFAKAVTGGRAGVVYHVTNLNDSGTGSFRDAVSTSGRIIVFDVGGYVQLTTAVSAKSNLTIAGQTAPGGGIGFSGGEISFASQSNVIIRHIRIRPGSDTASSTDDALSLYRAHDVIIDHTSLEFAPWDIIDGVSDDWQNYPVTNITFQDSMIADPTGQQFGAHTESVQSNWSWYRNIFANSHNRNPLAKVNTVFVNNLLYNYSAGYTTHTSTNFTHDILNNYFVMGPASTGTDNTWYQVDKNQSIYYSGNLKDSNLNGTLDGTTTTPYWYQGTGTVLTSPWSTETNAVAPLDAASGARMAISEAGALPRDSMDTLIVSQINTLGKGTTGTGAGTVGPSGGLYGSQTDTGLANNGYGTITSGTRPTDTDNDGMPDVWENATGSNPATNDAMTKAADGYVLLEHYINWLAGPHAQTAAGASVGVDLSAYAAGFAGVSPSYAASGAQNGTVTLSGSTAQFQPSSGFHGTGGFAFKVSGSDGTSYTGTVSVLVTP